MQSKLIIKNFGPIDNATLNFKSVNIIIGAQGSGKSTIAKLYTICNSPKSYHLLPEDQKTRSFFSLTRNKRDLEVFQKLSIDKFKDTLEVYSIGGSYSKKTEIIYDCPTHYLEIKNGEILFKDKLDLNKIIELEDKKDYKEVEKEFDKLAKLSDRFNLLYKFSVMWARMTKEEKYTDDIFDRKYEEFTESFNNSDKNLTAEEIYGVIEQARNTKAQIFYNSPLYIPSERVLVHLLKKAALNFQRYDIPIPEHLLNFASVYNSATDAIKTYSLDFINSNTIYKNVNGEDRIYYSSRKNIKLSESASGFQSILPILLSIQYEKEKIQGGTLNYSFVIEEPETNLFPKAQYDLLKILEGGRLDDYGKIDKGSMHLYTTHSPFILSSINNLLFAHKKGNDNNQKNYENINKIIDSKSWINPNDFSAYQIIKGKVKSTFNLDSGLIEQNIIDGVSEEIINDFREIALASMD